MPIKLNTASGGGVTLSAANTATDKTITVPADDGTMIYANSSGNVGIGVTPSAWGSSYKVMQISSSASFQGNSGVSAFVGNNCYFDGSNWRYITSTAGVGTQQYGLNPNGNGGFGWFQAASGTAGNTISFTQSMTLDSSGNLLVGQTAQTSAEKFGVTQSSTSASSARFYASSTSYTNDIVQISCARSGATTEYNALTVFDNNTTLKMLIRANGNLLNANNSYGSLSDQRIKENIVDATPKLEKINQVRVVNFNMIGDERKQIGVVAQELEQIFPGMVEEDQEGIKAVKYSVFVPMLIKAIQEQQQMIETLQAKVAALEAK